MKLFTDRFCHSLNLKFYYTYWNFYCFNFNVRFSGTFTHGVKIRVLFGLYKMLNNHLLYLRIMCTSYLLTVSEDFPGYFDVSHGLPRDFLNQEFVAFPGSMMPVVTRNSPNKVEMMQWGLIPSWSKDIKLGKKLFNARSETLLEKPLFRSALLNHCIIPANSFYEWSGEEGHKTKINFSPKKEAYLYIAGIYDTWIDAEKNEHKTYTMITREALSTVGKYHNRQPLMLSREEMELWLSKDTTLDQLKRLLKGTQTPTLDVDDTPKGESTQSLL